MDTDTSIERIWRSGTLPEEDTRDSDVKERDRIFYSLALALVDDYETVVKGKYFGRIPKPEGEDREIGGAHGSIITYNCHLSPHSIGYFDAKRLDPPVAVEDIPTEKEENIEFVREHFHGDNARIIEESELRYKSAKLENFGRVERFAKKRFGEETSISDLIEMHMGGAKEPNPHDESYGMRTTATFSAAFLTGGYSFMRDMSWQGNPVSPGKVYEFGLDGLIRTLELKADLNLAEPEDAIDLDTQGGFDTVGIVLTEYGPNPAGPGVVYSHEKLLTEDDLLWHIDSSIEQTNLLKEVQKGIEDIRKRWKKHRRSNF